MADERLKNLRGPGRRDFLRWSATVGALLGLERARFLDALSGTAGTAMADQAACASTNRSVHLVAGNGGFAWFQLLWPHVDVAKNGGANVAYHTPGQAQDVPGTDKPLVYAAQSPFKTLGPKKQITAFMAGNNETHTSTPQSAATIATGTGMIAAMASIQQANPTLLPVIGVNPLVYGAAPGAPGVATVANSGGLVDLFNSAASRTLLAKPASAALNDAYYKAFLNLNAAAGRKTWQKQGDVAKVAANLLGKNLSDQLRPTPADDQRYGITGARTNIVEIGRTLIIAAKAFKLGLTASVIAPAMRDDPHGAFNNMTGLTNDVTALGKIFDAFMADLASIDDPSGCGKKLSDGIVFTVHGDTPKTPLNRNGWPDGTPGNSNWVYVYGNGYLKTGWFGGITAGGQVQGFDPATGANAPYNGAMQAQAAAAAAAFAVAKGDMRRVQDFYRGGSIAGIVNALNL